MIELDIKKIYRWELIGFLVISLVGSLLHFVFEWSGYWKPLALIGAVNESVWEHLKIGFWPAFFYAVLEYFAFGKKIKHFWLSKTLGLYIIPIAITLFFYGYTALLGHHTLFLDIAIFFIAILLAQIASLRLLVSVKDLGYLRRAGAFFLGVILVFFSISTYFPGHYEIFKDPRTGIYGIPPEHLK